MRIPDEVVADALDEADRLGLIADSEAASFNESAITALLTRALKAWGAEVEDGQAGADGREERIVTRWIPAQGPEA